MARSQSLTIAIGTINFLFMVPHTNVSHFFNLCLFDIVLDSLLLFNIFYFIAAST